MSKDTKRSRGSNWSHEQTVALAELKREASLSKETGKVMWKRISQKISSRFPDQRRSDDQCRRRWDNLVKVYNRIEPYCVETGQDHWQLDDDELAFLQLETAYGGVWYDIVQEVIRKERGLVAGMMSNGSNTGSHSDLLPDHTPARDTLPMPPQASTSESVTASLDAHHKQSSADNVQVSSRPSRFEVSKLSPEKETEQDEELLEWADAMVEIPIEEEQVETRIVPSLLERECPSHHQQYGAINIAGGMGINLVQNFGVFEAPPWDTNDSNTMDTYMSQYMYNLKISAVSETTSRVLEGTISGQASGRNKIIQGLVKAPSDLQSVSEEDQQSQPCALPVIELKVTLCCDFCIRKLTKKLEAMDGVKKPVIFDRVNMKVSVTATAEPEDVLKQVQMVKKTAVMWPHQK